MLPADETIRAKLAQNYANQGVEGHVAEIAAIAAHPMEGDIRPSRKLRKTLVRSSARFARKRMKAPPDEVLDLVIRTLEHYKDLATTLGDDYYRDRFEKDLDRARTT